ncbi:dynein regulatory complex subunit 2 [Cheilinus undulatus]|uniref:dynein regulatory complex subunit 2 n=1 Tax=Cheilinus undulatus TaxID=241271 RepID=UPI001BD551D8|nr:dynein regulatory complex subunit 2 [Cheilinus undulatus]
MPKKSKKGGGGKTEGERMLFMQQRAQAEEEMARKKEEMLTQFLRDKLQEDERNTRVNMMKLNEGWRSILRQTRCPELRKQILIMRQTLEREMDQTQDTIKTLAHDLQESERQSAQVRRAHLQQLEYLWAQQEQRLMFLQQQWESSLQKLRSSFTSDRKEMTGGFETRRSELEDAMVTLQKQHDDAMSELHEQFSTSRKSLQSSLEARKSQILHRSLLKLEEETKRRQRAEEVYREEVSKVEQLELEIQGYVHSEEKSRKEEERLQDLVTQLEVKLLQSKAEQEAADQDLLATADQMNRSIGRLRNQLIQSQKDHRRMLTDLTIKSNNTTKELKAIIAKGEKVARAGEMCRKLESQVLTLLPPLLPEEEQGQEVEAEDLDQDVLDLRLLNRRINGALLQRDALKKHKQDLRRENQQLRLLLRQHLDSMAVRERHLDPRHALLNVNPAPTATALSDTNRRHTVIEAVHVIKHSLKD